MKKYILLLFILTITQFCFSQNKEVDKLYGDFKITKIDSLKNHYLITAINLNNVEVLILSKKIKGRVKRKYKKYYSTSIIKVNENYKFSLESMTTSIGYLPTSKVIMDDEVIWERDKSKLFLFETKNLAGLYHHF
jgi:hypothetical protein